MLDQHLLLPWVLRGRKPEEAVQQDSEQELPQPGPKGTPCLLVFTFLHGLGAVVLRVKPLL